MKNDDELKDHQENDDKSENKKNLEYKPERALFYYIFDKEDHLIEGEETISGFKEKAQQELTKVSTKTITD